jgi:hypothetical protein
MTWVTAERASGIQEIIDILLGTKQTVKLVTKGMKIRDLRWAVTWNGLTI